MTTDEMTLMLETTGLKPIIIDFQENKGLRFHWYAEETMLNADKKQLDICTEQIEEMSRDFNVPLESAFVAAVAHELGHAEAFLRDQDYADELLAWEIAEQILEGNLPQYWVSIKTQQMNTPAYRWYLRRQSVSPEDRAFHLSTSGCPTCKNIERTVQSSPLQEYDEWMRDFVIACPACRRQYRKRFKRDVMTEMWEMDRTDYFPI